MEFSIKRIADDSNYPSVGWKPGEFHSNSTQEKNLVLLATNISSSGTISRIEFDDDNGSLWATDSISKPLGVIRVGDDRLINKPDGTVNFAIVPGSQFVLTLNPAGTILMDNEVANYKFFHGITVGKTNVISEKLALELSLTEKLSAAIEGLVYPSQINSPMVLRTIPFELFGETISKVEIVNYFYQSSAPLLITKSSMRRPTSVGTKKFFKELTEKLIVMPGSIFKIPEDRFFMVDRWRKLREIMFDNLVNIAMWKCALNINGLSDIHVIGRQIIGIENGSPKLGNYIVISTSAQD